MSKPLEKIESRLQKWIEGAGKIFSPGSPVESLSEELSRCLRENAVPDVSGMVSAPSRYIVEIHPSAASGNRFNGASLEELAAGLAAAASDAGILLPARPEIIIESNPAVARGGFRVRPDRAGSRLGNTASVNIIEDPGSEIILPQGAYLIVNSVETIQLEKPVVNIGRRSNNDIVLDDPRVSRNHAQLRLVKGNYVVFDLDSSGGTFVNNLPVRQKELLPGDVISLAGVPIIFGQDSGGAVDGPQDQTPTNQLLDNRTGKEK